MEYQAAISDIDPQNRCACGGATASPATSRAAFLRITPLAQASRRKLLMSRSLLCVVAPLPPPSSRSSGVCGRCFEVKCVTGPVQNDYSKGLGQDLLMNKPEENAKAGSNFMSDNLPNWKVRGSAKGAA